jgi:hypothetical protein
MRTHRFGYVLASAAAALAAFALAASDAPAASLKDLLDGKTALQAYSRGLEVRVRNLATGADRKVFTRSGPTVEAWAGGINHDGTKLCCMDGRRLCVVNLDGSDHRFVAPQEAGAGYFWRDPSGRDWVVYIGEKENKSQKGTTWRVRIDAATNRPVESTREKIADQQYSAGLGGSGVYLFESYGKSFILNLKTGTKSVHLNSTQNCVGSAHPGGKPWMMYEESPAHHDVVISEWNEATDSARYIWRYHEPASEVFGKWSTTDDRFATITKEGEKRYLVRLEVDTRGDGDNEGSWEEAPMGLDSHIGGVWIGD